MSYEIVRDNNIEIGKDNHIAFLNWNYISTSKLKKFKETIKDKKTYSINKTKIEKIAGISDKDKLAKKVKSLIPFSFIFYAEIKLQSPYFSKDDDEFYIIQNPCLKETNFKVPMIRGSAWKGALASAFRELFKENKSNIESFLRIFGAGSESIKAIEQTLSKEARNLKKAKEKLPEFLLFELGLEVKKEDLQAIENIKNKDDLINFIKNKLSKKLEDNQKKLPIEFQTHKGRVIFYPTYFDKLSLEIINPHDRRKRAGKNPIHYEVVPKDTEGVFQLIYIPFDVVLKRDEEVREETKEDLANIIKALSKLSNEGIGAKTKLGWGRFEIRYLSCFRNFS